MPETITQGLSGVAETLLVPLYLRAEESQRPDALIKDEKAVALVAQLGYDFDRVRQIPLSEANKLVLILRSREFDRRARHFLDLHPQAVVVHIGCGLDSRFERVDNGQVAWYDLDLPEVITARRRLLGDETQRYHLLACSVLEDAWLEAVSVHQARPILFLAEGVFMYFEGAQVKRLVLKLRDRFPGVELVFDSYSPLHAWLHNHQTSTSKIAVHVRWAIWRGQEVERWGDPSPAQRTGGTPSSHKAQRSAGVRLLDEWTFIDEPDQRLAYMRWLRPFEHLFRTMRIYQFQLGKAGQ